MSCSPFDLRDYFLRELADPQQRQVEAHVKICQPCREELDRLRITEAALFSLRDEEIPQRIAFVSDKIFEPSPWRRWWTAFWGSTARLGFASACLLSAAIVVHAFRPAPAPVERASNMAAVKAVSAPAVSEEEIRQRIQAAVDKAVPEIEARYEKRADQMVKATALHYAEENKRNMLWAEAVIDRQEKEKLAIRLSGYNTLGASK